MCIFINLQNAASNLIHFRVKQQTVEYKHKTRLKPSYIKNQKQTDYHDISPEKQVLFTTTLNKI